jgi:CspA family cold shock protein
MPKGMIKRIVSDRGFGFIQLAQGADLFFHSTELQAAEFASLREGQEVEFEIGKGRDGRAQAVKVKLTQPGSG